MAVKTKITKAEYDKLSDERKKDYKAGEFSDTYVLDTDEGGEDDPAELRRALAREREDRKKAQKELRELKEKGEGDDGDEGEGEGEGEPAPKGKGKRATEDAAKIDRDWKAKFDKETGKLNAKLAAKDTFIKKQMIEGTANSIAAKISTSPKLLAKAIQDRLSVDMDGDEPELVILGDDGKASGLTVDKLEKEFVANKEYSSIIIGSKASGGGAPKTSPDTKTGGGAPASDEKTDLSKLSGKDLAATLKARKEANAT